MDWDAVLIKRVVHFNYWRISSLVLVRCCGVAGRAITGLSGLQLPSFAVVGFFFRRLNHDSFLLPLIF
jgi:hypothetical protein